LNEGVASAEAVKALERAGWGEKAGSYGLLTGRITARFVEPLLDAAGVAPGMRVLDVGTGPGHAAERAAERGAVATGVDIADEPVALARRSIGGVRFLRGDAEDLPSPSARSRRSCAGLGSTTSRGPSGRSESSRAS
jgi:2-polyprenyl-3-methyl-5-hydroxy-6-metoxy-1,4-benzoquinol methylase